MNEELKIIISAEINKLKQELQKGKKEVEEFSKKGESKLATFNEAMGKVGSAANKAMGIAAAAITGAAAALLALSASTQEYRTNQAKLLTAFETAGASAEVAKNTYNDLYRVMGDDGAATEAAQMLAKLTTNEKDLAEWTTICQGVYAEMGSTLPIESLAEAANETAKVGTVTGALADALNWVGISEDAFNEKLAATNTEAEREKLIRETLNGVYGEAAAKYEENAADVLAANEAQIKLNDATAKLGKAMAPVNTALAEFGAAFVEQIAPAIQDFVDNYGAALTEGLKAIADAIGVVVGWIADNIELVGTIAGVILAIVAAINLYNAAMAIYNIVMAPVNLTILAIVAAIVALIAIITACIVYWDEIKAAAVACWDWICQAWENAGNWFNETIVQPIVGFFTGLWSSITDGAKKAWQGIKNAFSAVSNWFKDVFSKAWNGVKNVFSTGGKIFSGIKEGIEKVFKTVVNGIIDGINKVVSVPFNAINGALKGLRDISIAGAKPFSWLPTLTVPQIPKLAKGGIAYGDTLAHIGEEGFKEAVLPLDRNTEWMDMLAARLGERIGGGNVPVVLQVDGKTFAQTAISTINQQTRQTGKLALNIM